MGRPKDSPDEYQRTRGWTKQQLIYLQKNYYYITDDDLSDRLGKSVRQLRKKAREIGLGPKIRTQNPL